MIENIDIKDPYIINDYSNVRKKGMISIVAFNIFLISPLFSLPFIFWGIYKNERFSLFLAALFFGIVTYMIKPYSSLDISRYYEAYDFISKNNLKDFISFLKTENDYLFYCIYYIFSLFGLKFQYVLLFLSTTCFYLSFLVFDNISKHLTLNMSKNQNFLFFILFLLSLPVLSLISTTRFSIGYTFFMLYVYHKLVKKDILSYVFLALAIFTHFAYIIYLPFLLVTSKIKNKKLLPILIFSLAVLSMGVPIDKIIEIVSNVLPSLSLKMITYIQTYENTYIKIFSSIQLIPVYLSILFLILYYKYIPSNILYLFLSTLILVVLTLPFNMIIYDRFIQVFKPILALTLVFTFYNKKLLGAKKSLIKVLSLMLYLPFSMYYAYTFYIIYRDSLKEFFSLNKILLVSILDTSYTFYDFFNK